jgi:DNA-binding transcriptional ArsR family regulator
MDDDRAVLALSALAQDTRLQCFRMLVCNEPGGLPAGEIARQLNVPQNTMSSHLGVLARAGLVQSERDSRSIIYRADLTALREVMLFLIRDCCSGSTELCVPLIAELSPSC